MLKNLLKESKEAIVDNLIILLKKTIKKNTPKPKVGLLLSGGLDSSIIASILKKAGHNFTGYVVEIRNGNFKKSEDIFYAKKLAKDLNIKLKIIKIINNEIEDALKTIFKLTKNFDVVSTSIALPLYFGFKKAHEDNCTSIFSGTGSDAIFAGFEKHKKAKDINKECLSCVLDAKKKINSRDKILAKHCQIKLISPFLTKKIIDYSLKIPSHYKIKDGIEKYILREVALKLSLPQYIVKRKKKAIQYSSNCQKSLRRLAKINGFRKIKDYFNAQFRNDD